MYLRPMVWLLWAFLFTLALHIVLPWSCHLFSFLIKHPNRTNNINQCLLTLGFLPETQDNELFVKLHSFVVIPIMSIYCNWNISKLSINDSSYPRLTRRHGLMKTDFFHDVGSRDCSVHVSASVLVSPAWASVVKREAPLAAMILAAMLDLFLKMFVE